MLDDIKSPLTAKYPEPDRVSWPWTYFGMTDRQQGWKIHISCAVNRMDEMIAHLQEIVGGAGVPFKHAETPKACALLNEGAMGGSQIGKCATLYPGDDAELVGLARRLVALGDFGGPNVPDDIWLGGAVHIRYGGFNPVVRRNILGQTELLIADKDGVLVTDGYSFDDTMDRFNETLSDRLGDLLQPRVEITAGQLLDQRYLVVDVLRQTDKAALFQAVDIQAKDEVRPMILKQGKMGVLSDIDGRDIQDRLAHQHAMHSLAAPHGLAPKCGDIFRVGFASYLPMECILQDNFEMRVRQAFHNQKWGQIDPTVQEDLLAKLAKIARAVEKLHELGIVHRDLTPSNILITDDEGIFLSDLEIAVEIDGDGPVFSKGTPGFMSQAQANEDPPCYDHDIYAFAALSLFTLTGIDPQRIMSHSVAPDWSLLKAQSGSVSGSLWDMVRTGLSQDATLRPTLSQMADMLEAEKVPAACDAMSPSDDTAQFASTLHLGVASLTSPGFLSSHGLWLSAPMKTDAKPQHRRSLNRGISGIVYFLACYARHYEIDNELRALAQQNANWLIQDQSAVDFDMPGLHFGETGVLLALAEAVEVGLISVPQAHLDEILERIDVNMKDWPDVTHGLAGAALGLMQINTPACRAMAERYMKRLIKMQGADGRFVLPEGVDGLSGEKLSGFAHGDAGIGFALVKAAKMFDDDRFLQAAKKVGQVLMETAITTPLGGLTWAYSSAHSETWTWWCHGAPGISYLFTALFEATGDPEYAATARLCLANETPQLSPANLSLCHGLSGNGVILLDAADKLQNPALREVAHAYGRTILERQLQGETDRVWVVEDTEFVSADLMVGGAGVLQFLLRLVVDDPKAGIPGCSVPF